MQLHINIPLIEALEQMPKYAKFLGYYIKEAEIGGA